MRHPGCHNDSCEKWRIYTEWKTKDRAGRAEQIMKAQVVHGYRSESHRKFLKEKWWKEK